MSHQADRYRWYALGLTTLGQAAANILASGFDPLAPFLQKDFRISRTEIGLIATAMSLTAAPSVLFGGRAADRIGERHFQGRRRPVLLLIVLLTICSTLGAAVRPRQTPLFFVAGLAGLFGASAFAWTGVLGTLVIETAGRESAGSALSLVQVLATPASLLGPPVFGFLTDRSGTYHVAWLALALMGALGLFALHQVREEPVGLLS